MSDDANATAPATTTGDKSTSVLGGSDADTTKNGATGKETPASNGSANASAADGKGAEGTKAEGEKQPEAFDYTKWEPKLPEGISADQAMMDAFKPLAKELGLKGEGMQKLVDLWSNATKAGFEAQLKAVEDNRAKGFESLRSDKDIGGDKFTESMTAARRAVKEAGGQELADRLFSLGLDNDPVLVRAFVRLGKRMGEDSIKDTAAAAEVTKPDSFEDRVSRTYSKAKES
jgi:hypothetical protein